MSRRYRQSPVFYDPSPARWPWLMGLLLVATALVALWVVKPDILPVERLNLAFLRTAPSSDQPQPAGSDSPAVVEVPASPTAAPALAQNDVAQTPEDTAASPDEIAADWVRRWNAGDFAGMYQLTTGTVRRSLSQQDFTDRYEGIDERAELSSVQAEVTGKLTNDRQVPIRVSFTSGVVGEFQEENVIPLTHDPDGWHVAWTPSLIFHELGADGCVDVDRIPVGRGKILDRNGEPLAYDGVVERVGVVPEQIPTADESRILKALSDLTGMTVDAIKQRYASADPSWFVPIKDFPQGESDRLLDAISQLPGVSLKSATARLYPMGEKAAHITGYVSQPTAEQLAADPSLSAGQLIGQSGIEAGADEILAGIPGGRLIVVHCDSRVERSTIATREPVAPRDVVLTIDRDFQASVFDALKSQKNLSGAAVVIDPQSGALLALASVPSYDPNGFILGFSTRDRALLSSETQRPLLSRAAEGTYPTGSAFKPITFSAAMEYLGYTPDTVLDCPSTFQLDGAKQVWEDWTVDYGLGPQGPLTLHQALVNSCNTVFYGIGRDLDTTDPEYLPQMAKAFGLGEVTGIPYLPEAAGIVPDPAWKLDTYGDYWATGDAINLSIGQGFLQVTPLQLANAYAAIANGGQLLQPYVVATIVDANGQQEEAGKRMVRRPLPVSRATLEALQSALHDQTSDPNGAGSYKVFGDFSWPIAGKTGTAQRSGSETAKPHSWFAGFGPYGGQSEIASAVMYESAGEGVSFAAPTTRLIYEDWLQSDLRAELHAGA